jgi:hypothetical protein
VACPRIQVASSCALSLLRILWGAALFSLLLFAVGSPANAQPKTKTDTQERSFISLRDERDTIDAEIRTAEKNAEALTTQQYWLREETTAKQELEQRKKDKATAQDKLAQLQKRIDDARSYAATGLSLDEVGKSLEKLQEELKIRRRDKARVETDMSKKIDLEKPKQEFKTTISGYFTILIGFVILGFFVIAGRDPKVRQEIFSGQAGIQFITLFSLVIAIILFGVTEVLEGKELAALLGGLSGYILGRSTAARTSGQSRVGVSSPTITDISPKTVVAGSAASDVPIEINGSDLQLTNSVKVVQGGKDIPVAAIRSSDLSVNGTLKIDSSLPKGAYDVIVTNSDGGVAKLPKAFTVQ